MLFRPIFAYIDPGTGSYILQVLLAAFVGGLFMLKVFWKSIKLFFQRRLSPKKADHNDDT